MTSYQIVAVAITVAGAVAALSLLIKSARAGSRVLGIIGTVLLLMGLLSRFAFQLMVDRFLGKVDDSTIVSILAATTAAGGVLIGAGLLLITRAIVLADRMPKV